MSKFNRYHTKFLNQGLFWSWMFFVLGWGGLSLAQSPFISETTSTQTFENGQLLLISSQSVSQEATDTSLFNRQVSPSLSSLGDVTKMTVANVGSSAPSREVVVQENKSWWGRLKGSASKYYKNYFGKEGKVSRYVRGIFEADSKREIASEKKEKDLVDPSKLATLPVYRTQGVEEQTLEIEKIQKEVKNKRTFETHGGRSGDATLKKTKSGVLIFDPYKKITKTKNGQNVTELVLNRIPYLDIGVEPSVTQSSFNLVLPQSLTAQYESPKALESPQTKKDREIDSLVASIKYDEAQKNNNIEDIRLAFPQEITAKKISKVVINPDKETEIHEMPFKEIPEYRLGLLYGVIFSEYADKCHLAVGHLKPTESLTSEEKDLRDYNYGMCLFKLGFHDYGTKTLLRVIAKNDSVYSPKALALLLTDIKREYVPEIKEALLKMSLKSVPEKSRELYHYYIALGSAMGKQYGQALNYALKVQEASDKYPEAQYLASVAEYKIGHLKSSLERQEKLLLISDKRSVSENLKSMIKLNIGRTAFKAKNYQRAISSYQSVGNKSPHWIQSLTEQGWMQILAGDATGAIGNMFSIQMPQFKDIYKPESYAVRAVGYINICQYGDAKKSIDYLTKIYKPWIMSVDQEMKKQQYNYVFYQNTIEALSGKENKTILPQPILREIVRNKDFVNIQESINNKVDEVEQYGFINDIIGKDLSQYRAKAIQSKNRAKSLDVQIAKASSKDDTLKNVQEWKAQRVFEQASENYFQFMGDLVTKNKEGFSQIERAQKQSLTEAKQNLKSVAGKLLKSKLSSIKIDLEKIIENNEFLTYEVYAGSGENIRYISAGGKVSGAKSTRKIASQNSSAGKVYLWDFDGEFWADEVGNYKSSLVNNCANAGQLTNKVK